MKIISKIFILPLLVYTLGCSEAEKKTSTLSDKTEPTISADTTESNNSAQAEPLLKQADPVASDQLESVPTETSKTAVVLNPPHGQPGHDCAIPEGAPLNPQAAKSPATSAVQATNPMQLKSPQSAAAPKLNPAHGLPGHDCAIAVGAPLN